MGKILLIALVACVLILFSRRNKAVKVVGFIPHERKNVEGVLSFGDIVAWFKTITTLNKDEDTPFILKANDKEAVKEKFHFSLNAELTKGKQSILLGVFNQKENKITKSILVEADALDEKTVEVFGKESFVTLS